jgi:hypothetical protein
MTQDTLSAQLERLRDLVTRLAFACEGGRHDELIEQTRVAISDVRESRAALAQGTSQLRTFDRRERQSPALQNR